MLPPNGWRPGPGKVGQCGLKVLHLWCHSQPIRTPPKKFFFRVQSTRLYAFFETFVGSLERTGAEIFMRKPRAFRCFFLSKISKTSRVSKWKLWRFAPMLLLHNKDQLLCFSLTELQNSEHLVQNALYFIRR